MLGSLSLSHRGFRHLYERCHSDALNGADRRIQLRNLSMRASAVGLGNCRCQSLPSPDSCESVPIPTMLQIKTLVECLEPLVVTSCRRQGVGNVLLNLVEPFGQHHLGRNLARDAALDLHMIFSDHQARHLRMQAASTARQRVSSRR
jgi:hypothetical protein